MDTSRQYIKMCERATEIQLGAKAIFANDRDFYVDQEGHWWTQRNKGSTDWTTVWLPTQEDLQWMAMVKLGEDAFGLVELFFNFVYGDGNQPNQIDTTIISMNQLWLAFVMKELYQKVWDNDRGEWVKV